MGMITFASLEIMTIDITTPDVPTREGVPVTLDGVAQIKIGSDEEIGLAAGEP